MTNRKDERKYTCKKIYDIYTHTLYLEREREREKIIMHQRKTKDGREEKVSEFPSAFRKVPTYSVAQNLDLSSTYYLYYYLSSYNLDYYFYFP